MGGVFVDDFWGVLVCVFVFVFRFSMILILLFRVFIFDDGGVGGGVL